MRKNNSILILSNEDDVSTSNVMKWLYYIDNSIEVIRLHPEDLYNGDIEFVNIKAPLIIKTNRKHIDTNAINVFWTRKWSTVPTMTHFSIDEDISDNALLIRQNLRDEFNAFFRFFLYKIEENKNVYWLNNPKFIVTNKLQQLLIAEDIGMHIPSSFLSTKLKKQHLKTQLITKHISDSMSIYHKKNPYVTYTHEINIKTENQFFFISLFQEKIQKELEIRVFYLAGKCYSLAILSQS